MASVIGVRFPHDRRRFSPTPEARKTLANFTHAWEAKRGFGVPRPGSSPRSPSRTLQEVLTVGLVELDPADPATGAAALAEQEHQRHEQITEVIESAELREF